MARPAPTWRDPRFPRQLMWTFCTPIGVLYALVWTVVYLVQLRPVRALAIFAFGYISGAVWLGSIGQMTVGGALLGGLVWCGVVFAIDRLVWRRRPALKPPPSSLVTPGPEKGTRGRLPRPY